MTDTPHGFDAVDLDMIKRGDMLGSKLGERVFEALTAHRTPDPEIDGLIGEMRAGLKGLPEGAWRAETDWPANYDGYVVCAFFGETPHMPRLPQAQAFVVAEGDFDDALNPAMARHAARCSPDNITKLLQAIADERARAEKAEALLARAETVLERLEGAGRIVLHGLNARIDAAPSTAKPVFNGIVDLHDELNSTSQFLKEISNDEA